MQSDVQPAPWEPGTIGRLVFDAVGTAVGIGFALGAAGLGLGSMAEPGAGFFPLIAAALVIVCLAIDLVRQIVRLGTDARQRGHGRVSLRVWLILAAIAFYAVAVSVLGHMVTATVMVAAMLVILGRRSWWRIALIAVIAGVATDLLFSGALGLRLPTGILELGWSEWI